jgi:hypothetical protein
LIFADKKIKKTCVEMRKNAKKTEKRAKKNRAVSESISENSAPIAVFPEKTTGNGRGLLEFDSVPSAFLIFFLPGFYHKTL